MGGKGHHGFSRDPGRAEIREASASEVCAAAGDREFRQNGKRKKALIDVARLQNRHIAFRLTAGNRSEEHTFELQSQSNLVCRLLLEKKKTMILGARRTH